MNLTTKTETLGQAVEAGLITKDEAVRELVEFAEFADGGLTTVGAEEMIDTWRTVRNQYETQYKRAFDDLIAAFPYLPKAPEEPR